MSGVTPGAGPPEYAYSGGGAAGARILGAVLWSDPDPDAEPPEELRRTQVMLRRLGVLMALAMVVAMALLGMDTLPP
ncbi:hypothetical protein M2169_002315 [Streptomyces sp. MJP52]|nr:hypothetical protein [Streptomyces sp. MJP52]